MKVNRLVIIEREADHRHISAFEDVVSLADAVADVDAGAAIVLEAGNTFQFSRSTGGVLVKVRLVPADAPNNAAIKHPRRPKCTHGCWLADRAGNLLAPWCGCTLKEQELAVG